MKLVKGHERWGHGLKRMWIKGTSEISNIGTQIWET